jgi:uncharacterized protein YjfI (DUF2170 family)
MKKTIFIFLLSTISLFSQVEIERQLGEFSKVSVYDGINLELVKSEENKVEISGKNTSYIVVKNKNGDLKIRLNLEKRFAGDNTVVKLFYKTLYNIISHEGANVFSKDVIKQSDLFVKASTGSTQSLVVNLNTLKTTAATGAKIEISGESVFHETTVTTESNINAQKLTTVETEAVSNTGGIVDVSASKELKVNSKLGGIINVHKKTDKITEKISTGGVVNYLYNQ